MAEGFVMIRTIADFENWWNNESGGTRKVLAALTDASLSQAVAKDHRTIGRMAWHIVQSMSEMPTRLGLKVDAPAENAPVPTRAAAIQQAYDRAAGSLLAEIKKNWNDATLLQEDDMYGSTWTRSFTLFVLIGHEIHHRGQMTVLMRQAGLKVPGIYGPSYDEWGNYGGQPPVV
ncbi:MAG: DinB family protein [Candidatus Zixiibacteriota bacterium]